MKKILVLMLLAVGLFSVQISAESAGLAPTQPSFAQEDDTSCRALVTDALRTIGSACVGLGRNEVCYGNRLVSAVLRDNVAFDDSGDIAALAAFESLITRPSDPDTGEWGVALLNVQADLPEAADTGVTLVMLGGVELSPAIPSRDADSPTCTFENRGTLGINMRSGPSLNARPVDVLDPGDSTEIYGLSADGGWYRSSRGWVSATTGDLGACEADLPTLDSPEDRFAAPGQNLSLAIDNSGSCDSAPSALMIQAPTGQTANVMVNGVEIRIGSTAAITMNDDNSEMVITNMDNEVSASYEGQTVILPVGSSMAVGMEAGSPTQMSATLQPMDPTLANMDPEIMAQMMPETVQMPTSFSPGPDVPLLQPVTGGNRGNSPGLGTGQWGACGSCADCGPYLSNECVLSPEGACVWDPATCRNLPGGSGAGLINVFSGVPAECNLSVGITQIYIEGEYIPNDGNSEIVLVSGSVGIPSLADVIGNFILGPTTWKVEVECSNYGTTPVTIIIVDDTGGTTSRTVNLIVN